jgi:Baseplate J-like protein
LNITGPPAEDLSPARSETDHLLALHDPAPGRRAARVRHLRINNAILNLNDVKEYSRLTGIVLLGAAPPSLPFNYTLVVEIPAATTEFRAAEDTSSVPELSWEYWNGRGWLSLTGVTDGTHNLLKNGDVTFKVPKNIEATEVAGQENYWIRARLVGGDYGRETFKIEGPVGDQKIVSVKSSLRPPKVRVLLISYKASPVFPEACLAFNNLEYLDQTAACEAPDSHFPPFETLEDKSFTMFFGFDKTFKTGPVRLLLDAAERDYDETKPPEFAWSFRKDRIWKNLDAEDGTVALTRQGILTVSASEELTQESRFGESLYWIKGSLRTDRALAEFQTEGGETLGPCGEVKENVKDPCAGLKDETEPTCADSSDETKCKCADCNCLTQCSCAHSSEQADDPCAEFKGATQAAKAIAAASAEYPLPLLRGVFLNTVEAIHGETITEEVVGSGDGEQNQIHKLQQDDVLEGEDIRIQEPLSVEERERIERELGKDSVVDREDIGGTWVRWKEVKALFDCGKDDRCYEIDRADGILKFGDGEHGRVVPAGVDNIRAFRYRTGGGSVGNVSTNKIEALATAVAGIESVFNPAPAGGGSDKADTDDMLTIGPRRISHGDRAVSVEDFEELAYEASRQVKKVRCLGTKNLVRTGIGLPDPCDPRQLHQALEERGRVSLIIVPDSPDPRPCPSLELRRAVKKYLRDRSPSVLDAEERIVVRPPDYVTVSVYATIFVSTLDKASAVETEARKKLEEFLHPLRGGPEGDGWEFGRPVTRSDIFALLERIADIDRVEDLVFQFRDKKDPDRVRIEPNELLATGEHKLAIKKKA